MKPGLPEILVIALVLILLFGARKIPDLMKGLGSGIREFKKAASTDDEKDAPDTTPKSTPNSH